MRIVKMTASFGCLDDKTLELTKGVNPLCMANESGKSTWAAFLLAMFYGLDTRRSAKNRLSDRERYEPWNGKPMQGQLELELKGRHIVLQRTSGRGRPFGVFRAWDRETGLEIPSLTAENCGRQLLGVEKEVFRRTAFLSGGELSVTPDRELSRRLGSLAASGRQTDSYLQAEQTLRGWQNRLRYHQSGEIPKCMQQLAQQKQQTAPQDTVRLPSQDRLLQMLAELTALQEIPQQCPKALQGVPPEEILPKTHRLLTRHWVLAAAAAAVTAGGIALGFLLHPWCFAGAAAGAILGAIHLCCPALPRAYGVRRHSQILSAAMEWNQWEKQRWQLAVLLEEIRDFAPEAENVPAAKQAVEQALHAHRAAAQAPDPGQISRLQAQLETLLEQEQAIILAREALANANRQLQQTYVPALTALAGEYLQELTRGHYDGLVMEESMELSVKQTDGMLRPLAALSSGTQDQVWLALRLAMTKLLLQPDTPIVLDDALLTFDEDRQSAALRLLEQTGRQVLVFSCK